MRLRLIHALVAASLGPAMLPAADLHGTIVVDRKLTKRNVTPSAGLYQRGVAVELNPSGENPLDYERSHVVVYLEGPPSANPVTVTMEQKDRRFEPDLLVIPAGSTVSFPNFDPIFHNVFSLSKPKSFDLGNYAKGQTRTVKFPAPGLVFVYCHLHPNMAASILISPNAWSTRADASGGFTLTGVPPGKYTIVAWHKTAGAVRQPVEVGEQGAADISFVIPFVEPEPSKHVAHR
jgi:plastocyanin